MEYYYYGEMDMGSRRNYGYDGYYRAYRQPVQNKYGLQITTTEYTLESYCAHIREKIRRGDYDDKFLLRNIDYLDVPACLKNNVITEKLIRDHVSEIHGSLWPVICEHLQMSEQFMRDHLSYLHFGIISKHQILTEEFMDDFNYKIDWTVASKYQNITFELAEKYQDRMDWNVLIKRGLFPIPFDVIEPYLDQGNVNLYFQSNPDQVYEENVKRYIAYLDVVSLADKMNLSQEFQDQYFNVF